MTRSSGGKGAEADGCCAKEDVHLRRQLGSRQPSAARPHGAPMCVSSHAAASRQGRHTATPGGLRPGGAAAWAAATEAGLLGGTVCGAGLSTAEALSHIAGPAAGWLATHAAAACTLGGRACPWSAEALEL